VFNTRQHPISLNYFTDLPTN